MTEHKGKNCLALLLYTSVVKSLYSHSLSNELNPIWMDIHYKNINGDSITEGNKS